MDAAKFVNTRK